MPTIQDEMSKVLNEWNKPIENNQPEKPTMNKPTHYFNVSNNITRITFDYVKANPGTTAAQASHALASQGYKASSVTSLIAQMFKQGMLRKDKYSYYVAQDEYTPLKARKKKTEKAVVEVLEKLAEPVKAKTTITAQSIVDNMTLKEARELYNELGKYFGA